MLVEVVGEVHAVVESFSARVKVELLYRRRWKRRLELSDAIFEYQEISHSRE